MNKASKIRNEQKLLTQLVNNLANGLNMFDPAEVEVTLDKIIFYYNKFINSLMEELDVKQATIIRIFFIDENGYWDSPVYFAKTKKRYFRLSYREDRYKLEDLNCLDAMRLQTYDVREKTSEVLEDYGKISIYGDIH